MNNDLISRNHAIEMLEYEKEHIDSEERKSGIDDAIEWIKVLYPANAVPMDKLCEWLQTNASYNSLTKRIFAEQWKKVLTDWMDGLDAKQSMV